MAYAPVVSITHEEKELAASLQCYLVSFAVSEYAALHLVDVP